MYQVLLKFIDLVGKPREIIVWSLRGLLFCDHFEAS